MNLFFEEINFYVQKSVCVYYKLHLKYINEFTFQALCMQNYSENQLKISKSSICVNMQYAWMVKKWIYCAFSYKFRITKFNSNFVISELKRIKDCFKINEILILYYTYFFKENTPPMCSFLFPCIHLEIKCCSSKGARIDIIFYKLQRKKHALRKSLGSTGIFSL